MRLWALVAPAARAEALRCAAQAGLAGLMYAGVVPIINFGVLHRPAPRVFAVLALLCALLLVAAERLQLRANARLSGVLEGQLHALRRDLAERLAASPLRAVELATELRADISRDIEDLDAVVAALPSVIHYLAMLGLIALYVLGVSPGAFLLWVGICVALSFMPGVDEGRAAMVQLNRQQASLHTAIERAMRAFPQLKLDAGLGEGVNRDLGARFGEVARGRVAVAQSARVVAVRSATILYIGVAAILFAAPHQLGLDVTGTYEIVTVLFLTLGPASYLLQELRTFSSAELAAANLAQVRALLSEAEAAGPPVAALTFSEIALRGVAFSYGSGGAPGFTVGPIDLRIRRGEVLFLTGANGSGKTTLMKLIAGLYPPSAGSLKVDGRALAPEDAEPYRALFSTIFTDQHLFSKLYGLEGADRAQVAALLRRFALDRVIGVDEQGRFTSLALSSGQRKRLSMVIALLEDRPIYLLDEWAAHQDPELRRTYYEVLLPELKAAGRTVIAVSHDDRFFHVADHVVQLRGGRLAADRGAGVGPDQAP